MIPKKQYPINFRCVPIYSFSQFKGKLEQRYITFNKQQASIILYGKYLIGFKTYLN